MLDNSPRADMQRLREARSRELRAATDLLDARQACLSRLATIDAEINDYEADERARNRRRRFAAQKLANAHYRDGTPKQNAKHEMIARVYAWGQKERKAPQRRGSASLKAQIMLRELERLWTHRYGGVVPNDDAGADDLWIAAQLIRARRGDVVAKVVAWARVWAPWCSAAEAAALAAHVLRRPYKFKADTLGEKVGLTYAERQALGITTIGSTDVGPAERERLRRERYNAKRREKRRAAGVKPREMYEQNSIESEAPWEAAGISRSTWQRRRRRAARVCGDPSRVELSQVCANPRTLADQNGSLEAPDGSLSAGSGGDREETRANERRDPSLASADCEAVVAGDRPVSSGSPAPVVPGADVAREAPLAPPRPHALRPGTALPSVEGGGLGVLQNVVLSVRLRPQLSNEARPVQYGIFRGWNNCCLCAEPFRVRGREELFCGEECRKLGREIRTGARDVDRH
ncbi:hypothetical protein [Bradyrhizobium sp.]|uniref:hypothetical protein n=1 Tax=Bradyrhizobium sp. TaxID=376 RepID=UPI0039E5619C